MPDTTLDLRPRSTGEVLDDAWRLALADAPLLLLFLALFEVPAFVLFVLLLTQEPQGALRPVLPAVAALFLPLTGIASGACQELFRRRLEEQPVRPMACLAAALRDSLRHSAGRALVLAAAVPAFLLMLMPGFLLWAAAAPLHALIADRRRGKGLLVELRGEAAIDPAKAALAIAVRVPLLLVAAVNLHLLLHVFLWIGENFVGLDTALLAASLALFRNSVYTLGVILLAWLLLSPFFEASNFLLHLDARTRQEGLDLFYRVRRVFPTAERAGPVRIVGAVVVALLLFAATAATAAGPQADTIRAVRAEVETIRDEIRDAEPYPGSGHWLARLQRLASRLEDGDWFRRALDGFAARDREGALQVVDTVLRRLALMEATPDEIRAQLRKQGPTHSRERAAEKKADEADKKQRDEDRDRDRDRRPGVRERTPVAPSPAWGGLGQIGWGILAALIVGVVGFALWKYLQWRREQQARKPAAAPAVVQQQAEALPPPDERSAAELWRRAEAAARAGDFRQALRWMYLAVLFLLDTRQLLRYEATRTNGEYLRQLRRSEHAPPTVHEPFQMLTDRFDTSWYGSAATEDGDYREFRRLAETVRDNAA
jgi:hypothetical protein